MGVALAFTGTLLIAAAANNTGLPMIERLWWTGLMENASRLDPAFLKAGFIFMVIGYGTKAGLAPMHNWLPDAHSQAPAPVSAIFSGFLLNAALYCILRYLPLVDAGLGETAWARSILIAFGLISIIVAATFIVAQNDLKRLLAYSSVEHMGIIALGAGIGGLGTVAALFHVFNHSLGKTMSFFCAGRLGQARGTYDMRELTNIIRTNPPWGAGMVGGLLALIGAAPFALFLSELLILKASLDAHAYWVAILFLAGLGTVFVGVARHLIAMAWGSAANDTDPPRVRASRYECFPLQSAEYHQYYPSPLAGEGRERGHSFSPPPRLPPQGGGEAVPPLQNAGDHLVETVAVFAPLAVLMVIGVWVPTSFWQALNAAARVVGGIV